MVPRIARFLRRRTDWIRNWRQNLSWSAQDRARKLERPSAYFILSVAITIALGWTFLPWFVPNDATRECTRADRSDCLVRCQTKESPNRQDGGPRSLVVLLHAFTSDSKDLGDLQRVANQPGALPDADVLLCDLPFGALSMVSPDKVAADLIREIEREWGRGYYHDLRLVGHSMGALFARKVYVVASGESRDARFGEDLRNRLLELGAETVPSSDGEPLLAARPWVGSVERIVLMAGMNRGWSISHHTGLLKALRLYAGVAVGRVLAHRFDSEPLVFAARRGAAFLTNLRLQWLEMKRASETGTDPGDKAMVIQLLGTVDDLVSPEDNIDLVTGREFFYLDVPRSGHQNVIEMGFEKAPPDAMEEETSDFKARNERAGVFKLAIAGSRAELCDKQIEQEGGASELAAECEGNLPQPTAEAGDEVASVPHTAAPAEREVTDVVFVIHGIRDKGHWTQKIARRVKARARATSSKRVESVAATYGYFPMLPFLRPHARRQKVEWLMDRYTEARADYPAARFHYVGHSNGTYLLAKALQTYPSVRFDRVVFVGSVVRTDYSWEDVKDRGQVRKVLNLPASKDWVVAFFPKALELAELQDLGSAGHDGFQAADAASREQQTGTVLQPEIKKGDEYVRAYVRGGHSEALGEEYWESIASFIIDEPIPEDFARQLTNEKSPLHGRFVTAHAGGVGFFGSGAQYLGLGILCGLALILFCLVRLQLREWQRTLIVIGYLFLIWTVITRL